MMSVTAAGHLGLIARFAAKQAYKQRAGGMPAHFVVAEHAGAGRRIDRSGNG